MKATAEAVYVLWASERTKSATRSRVRGPTADILDDGVTLRDDRRLTRKGRFAA